MAGSTSLLRVGGIPSGYPAEIDSNVKIRWVDNLLVNMSEQEWDAVIHVHLKGTFCPARHAAERGPPPGP